MLHTREDKVLTLALIGGCGTMGYVRTDGESICVHVVATGAKEVVAGNASRHHGRSQLHP